MELDFCLLIFTVQEWSMEHEQWEDVYAFPKETGLKQ